MKITPIISDSNPLLKKLRGLQNRSQREKTGLFLIEGTKLVAEAFAKDITIEAVIVSKSYLEEGLPQLPSVNLSTVSMVEDKLFGKLTTTEGPCGIIAIGRIPHSRVDDLFSVQAPLIVIAEAIQDPGNLGTMIRTALAAGASGMILTKGTVDRFNPKVVRAAAGALFALPIVSEIAAADALAIAKAHDLTVIACEPTANRPYWQADMTGPTALIFGNEGQGFSEPILKQATDWVSIPMSDHSESLNVAISAAVILFGAAEQRLKAASTSGRSQR